MPVESLLSNSEIVANYSERTPKSAALAKAANELFPSGITHDLRYCKPYGTYIERGQGSRKWDVDGNEYVDYFGGHGSLIFGHNHPTVLAAVEKALKDGTHFGANHPLEVRWGELVRELIPSAERVRFTSSGTEATLLALRLARAFSGKKRLLRFQGNFHGWHDHMTSGYLSHRDGAPTTGVLPAVAEQVVLVPPGDIDAVAEALDEEPDIAAVFLEPTGGLFGMVPVSVEFLKALREITAKKKVLLVFDEIITGFRVSPGGAQGHFGVKPDLTTLGKIVAGGLPGGAVAGRKDILDIMDMDVTRKKGIEKLVHYGTFNANPVCAASGIATLELLADGDACKRANACGAKLRGALNALFERESMSWAAYGTFSAIHIFTNPQGTDVLPSAFDPYSFEFRTLMDNPPGLVEKLCLALRVNGIDMCGWPGGFTSAVHTDDDLDFTVEAFASSIRMLRREGEL